jgi:hypothetical protein
MLDVAAEEFSNNAPQSERVLTVPELKEFINRAVDAIFSSENDRFRTLAIHGLSDPQFLSRLAPLIGISEPLSDEDRQFVLSHLKTNDKEAVRSMLLENAESQAQRVTQQEADRLLASLDVAYFRKATLSFADSLKGKQGRPRKLRSSDYARLVACADSLVVLIKKILVELDAGTKKTPLELLRFWQDDHGEAASFLIGHYRQFERILKERTLKSRAKRVETRARLVADAVAGVEYGLSPGTSVERVRQARRALQPKN